MTLAQTASEFLSRQVRINTASGRTGKEMIERKGLKPQASLIRKMGSLVKFAKQQDKDGGFLGFLKQGASLVGFLIGQAVRFIGFSFTAVCQAFVTVTMQLSSINWNATDDELKQAIESAEIGQVGRWGSVAGQTVGWLAGITLGTAIALQLPVIGGAMLAKQIAGKTLQEAKEEILPALLQTIRSEVTTNITNQRIRDYMAFRSLIRRTPKELLEPLIGKKGAEAIAKWGTKGSPRFVISEKIEEAIEKIPNKKVRAFIENFAEELWDSFVEAGFVIAAELDSVVAQAKLANSLALGSQRAVELTLNAKAEKVNEEKVPLIRLPQAQMVQVVQTHLANYRLMNNRDVGLIIGTPIEEFTRAKPQSLRLIIDLYSVKEPPFYRRTDNFTTATISIPDVKRSALDWDVIKQALGGENGYTWGRFRATAQLQTGRRIMLYGGSEKEAESRVKALLTLTTAKLLTLNITEELKQGERLTRKKLAKETRKIYPGFFTVINREELLDQTQARASSKQNYRDARGRIPLWTKTAPANADDLIQSILRKGT